MLNFNEHDKRWRHVIAGRPTHQQNKRGHEELEIQDYDVNNSLTSNLA
jgi:hypothetical protein